MRSSVRLRATWPFVLLAVLAVWTSPTATAQTDNVTVKDRLPPDVYAYVAVPSVPEFKKRLNASSLGQLTKDKAFEAFLKDVEVALKQGSAKIDKATGLKLNELLEIPSGEFAVAVAKSKRSVPAVGLFLDFGKKEAAVDKLLNRVKKSAEKAGFKRKTVMHQGTRIVIYVQPTKAAPEDEDGEAKPTNTPDFSYFIKGTHLVFATDVGFLKGVLDRWNGKHAATFAKNAVFQYIMERTSTGRSPMLCWYVDPLGLLNAAILAIPDAPPEARATLSVLSLFGVTRFKAAGGQVDAAVGDYDSLSRTVMYVEQPTTGVLDLFRFPAVKQTPPKWVPADATAYSAMNWDLQKAYKTSETLFGLFSLGGPDALQKKIDEWAKDPAGPKVHLKKDVLDQLDGRIRSFNGPNADANSPLPDLLGFGVKDEKAISEVLQKIAKMPDFPGKSREYRKHTIYELDLDATFGAGGRVAVGVARSHLFVSGNIKVLEQVIRGDGGKKSLADAEVYRRVAGKFPKKTSMIGFSTQSASLQRLYETLRSQPRDEQTGIDFSKLPPFAALKKYLPPSGEFAVPDKNGVYLEAFGLRQEK